jgi:hypothetical protein
MGMIGLHSIAGDRRRNCRIGSEPSTGRLQLQYFANRLELVCAGLPKATWFTISRSAERGYALAGVLQ